MSPSFGSVAPALLRSARTCCFCAGLDYVFRLRYDGSGFFDAFLDHNGIRQLEAEHASGEADHGHLLYSFLVLERIRS